MDSILIHNAGLVLLHPFLKTLFHECNLIVNNQFKGVRSLNKAVFLMEYIATGENTLDPDNNYIINKILTGMDPVKSVITYSRLTKSEKDQCKLLLTSVLKTWGPLAKTSIEGLRGSFLSRTGLYYKDMKTLTVERSTLDILLNDVPWSISLIHFPWMTDFVKIEW